MNLLWRDLATFAVVLGIMMLVEVAGIELLDWQPMQSAEILTVAMGWTVLNAVRSEKRS